MVISILKKVIRRISKIINLNGSFLGFFLIEDHFYNPIPNFKNLLSNKKMFDYKYSNIVLDIESQINLLNSFKKYDSCLNREYETIKGKINFNNGSFGHDDSYVYFSIINSFKPKKIIEIGSGFSTLIAAVAKEFGKFKTEIICIEPYPREELTILNKEIDLIEKRLEEVSLDLFKSLDKNDILFIDSSHVIKTKNDVVLIYLEILPILKKGVIVHIHDISIPYEIHPAIFKAGYSWNEQYLLQALLTNNHRYKTLISGYYLTKDYFKFFNQVFKESISGNTGGSYWIEILE
jgi:predicted O-methyltransferase YrrM